jgi:translation initiation factor 2B subunit (eIF-2B alpha/beta/delta family)
MHQSDYYGKDNPFEPIKIIDYYELNFSLGNVIKYVLRAGKKDGESKLKDLTKALDYIQHEIDKIKEG